MAGRPRQFDADLVLDQFVEVFWEKGFEGTSLSDLFDRVSIPRQSFYNEFGNKEAVFVRVLKRYFDRVVGPNRHLLNAADANLETVESYLDIVASKSTRSGQPRTGCLIINTIVETEDKDSLAAKDAAHYLYALQKSVLNALRGAEKIGQLKTDLDLRVAAEFVVTTANGMLVMSKAGASRTQLRKTATLALAAIRS